MDIVGWIAKEEIDAFEEIKLAERPCTDCSLRSLPYDEHHYEKKRNTGTPMGQEISRGRTPGARVAGQRDMRTVRS
jgi:hypothetical protein